MKVKSKSLKDNLEYMKKTSLDRIERYYDGLKILINEPNKDASTNVTEDNVIEFAIQIREEKERYNLIVYILEILDRLEEKNESKK